MADAPDDPTVNGQIHNTSSAGGYLKGTTKLTANESQAKGNQCQC